MKRVLRSLVVIATVFTVFSCSEDTVDVAGLGSVKGTIIKAGTNEPISNVKIATNPVTSTVFTDSVGGYQIKDIPEGQYSISAQKEGLLAKFQSISIATNVESEVVIEMEEQTASNKPPNAAVLALPEDVSINQPIALRLGWSGSDPENDSLTYTVSLRNDKNTEIQIFENIKETSFDLDNLQYSTKYFWQVSSADGINVPVNSMVFTFETQAPPNNRIVYTKILNGNSVIYSSNEQGGTEIRLTSTSKNSFRPRRNNTTGKIAYLQSVGSQTHLFTINEDGSRPKQVTSQVAVSGFNLEEINFSWMSNGAKLLFPNQDRLYSIGADGGGLELIYQTENNKLITAIDVNEGSGKIALKTNDLDGYGVQIFTINNDGVQQDMILQDVKGAAGSINLSLDGTKLLYTYDVSGYESDTYRRLNMHVFNYNISSGSRTDISVNKQEGTNDLQARFSPNEASVIFVNTSNDGVSQTNIQTMLLTGEDRVTLVAGASMPDWE